MTIREVFAGVDQSQCESEVRQRWGDEAWERSTRRREGMDEARRKADDAKSLDVNAVWKKKSTSISGVCDPEP